MINLLNSRNYIVIKNRKELEEAKLCRLCRFIIMEDDNVIFIWKRLFGKWVKEKYVMFDNDKEKDEETTGLRAYQSFYSYCGKDEIERMKLVYKPIAIWESCEQMHYSNYEFSDRPIYQDIYEYDANSAFTYGTLQLPSDFDLLKEYMLLLYQQKKEAKNPILRSKFKNLQNFLIGYFARIKEFVKLRSEIINNSNNNINKATLQVIKNKGVVYLSNTDSIVTDERGAEAMEKLKGDNVGQFKLAHKVDRLFYRSSNIYQLGDKVVYSGVKYFARKNIDFFKNEFANQSGSLIEPFDFLLNLDKPDLMKICRVRFGEIKVDIYNNMGEYLKTKIYTLKEN